jgi:putative PIN family toxin of toxin-antitoxin system
MLVASMISAGGSNRRVVRACLEGNVLPILGEALFLEYEEVFMRPSLTARSPLTETERRQLLEAFFSVCEWVDIYFGWWPNLPDEDDNHLIELAVAGGANWIVTNSLADFHGAELRFPQVRIASPTMFLNEAMK